MRFRLKTEARRPYIEPMDRNATATLDKTTLARGADWLGEVGLRPTRQRLALAALLVGDGRNRHVTAESLFDLCLSLIHI